LEARAGIGAQVAGGAQRARYPRRVVEEFLAGAPRTDWSQRRPRLIVRASLYAGRYLDARTGSLVAVNESRVREYFQLAAALPNVNARFITGCPWAPRPADEPLYERLYAWKYGADPSGILYPLESNPRLLALYQAYAGLKGKTLPDVFCGGVFLMSPLRFSAEEAAQFVWWWEKGLHVGIAHMTTAGLTAPVTISGLATMNIAEEIALALLDKACYGSNRLSFLAMVAPLDMRTTMRPYGRPEMPLANSLVTAMARFYGVECFVQSGVSDAKTPGSQAGAQKTISALSGLMSGADAMIDAGLLSSDELYSPLQMVLDNELAGALERLMRPVDCSNEAIGFETMREVGPGGLFTAAEHTVERYRDEIWEPSLWDRVLFSAWQADGRKTESDRARETFERIMAAPPVIERLQPGEEAALRRIIEGG
ncbi:MAG: trimethylamine methyltransferase family protein, partial [Lentisphaerae bacterium]|nr:trimethylamine methyltransferase family protein [Lentisphaerota bacterium]